MTDLEKYIAECEKNAVPDNRIDLSDMPELNKADFDRGHFKNWKPVKKPISIRIDCDILSWLQSNGKAGYQKKLNDVLRWVMNSNPTIILTDK